MSIAINDILTRNQYTATASQTTFIYNFPIYDETYIAVYQRGASDEPNNTTQLLTLGTEYTVTGVGSETGGTIVLVTGATAGDIVTIIGTEPINRTSEFDELNSFLVTLNSQLNQITIMMQQTATTLGQLTPKYRIDELVSDDARPLKLELPMLNDNEIWLGRGNYGDATDDIQAVAVSAATPIVLLDPAYVIATAEPLLPNAQVLGGLGNGIIANVDDGTTGTLTPRTLTGTANQIDISDGTGNAGNPTWSLSSTMVMPGTGAFVPPTGTTAEQPGTPIDGMIRWNSTLSEWDGYDGSAWVNLVNTGGGVVNATYLTATDETTLLPNSIDLGALTTGLIFGTVAAGVSTISSKAIGVDVQAYSDGLESISGLTTAADKMIYTTALDVYAVTDLTTLARTLLGDATQATMADTILSGASLTSATVAATDKVLVQDADDSDNLKTVTAQSIADLAPAGTVTSVSGTVNRISSTGGTTPVIDIDAAYVGQTSLTTLGTITTGTWNATLIGLTYGGTGANLTASTGGIVYSGASALAILAGTATANQMLQSGASAAPTWSTATWPATTTVSQLLYSSATNTVTGLATANDGILVTSATGVPSIGTAIPDGVTATTQSPGDNSTKVATTAYVDATGGAPTTATYIVQTPDGTLTNEQALSLLATGLLKNTTTTGVLSIATQGTDYYAPGGTDVALADGGTNASLTASNGGIFYSTATAGAILAGTATAGQMLRSGSSAAPSWSTATWPATTTINQILYSSAANTVAGITAAASSILVTNGSSVPSLSTAIPDGVTATTQTISDTSTKVATDGFVNQRVRMNQSDVACNSNTTFTQNISTAHYFKLTFTSSCTLAFTFDSGLVQSMCLQLINAGAYTVTWSSILWAGGAAPTLTSSGTDIIVIWQNGDNVKYGALIGKAFA